MLDAKLSAFNTNEVQDVGTHQAQDGSSHTEFQTHGIQTEAKQWRSEYGRGVGDAGHRATRRIWRTLQHCARCVAFLKWMTV